MNYATIKTNDVANGEGVRVSLFVSGCTHRCKGCFNAEAWDFEYGSPFGDDTIEYILSAIDRPHIRGLSLLGGEPFEPQNQPEVLKLVTAFKKKFPEKTVWCYTGYDYEKNILAQNIGDPQITRQPIENIDILVDGRFVEELKNLNLRFKGSENQRIINVKESLKKGEVVLWEGDITLDKLSKW